MEGTLPKASGRAHHSPSSQETSDASSALGWRKLQELHAVSHHTPSCNRFKLLAPTPTPTKPSRHQPILCAGCQLTIRDASRRRGCWTVLHDHLWPHVAELLTESAAALSGGISATTTPLTDLWNSTEVSNMVSGK